jgi:hypothetical protein
MRLSAGAFEEIFRFSTLPETGVVMCLGGSGLWGHARIWLWYRRPGTRDEDELYLAKFFLLNRLFLFHAENCILGRFGHPKLHHAFWP